MRCKRDLAPKVHCYTRQANTRSSLFTGRCVSLTSGGSWWGRPENCHALPAGLWLAAVSLTRELSGGPSLKLELRLGLADSANCPSFIQCTASVCYFAPKQWHTYMQHPQYNHTLILLPGRVSPLVRRGDRFQNVQVVSLRTNVAARE